MHIEKVILSNFRCFGETPVEVTLDENVTALIGNNGSGKTTFLVALKRLFGASKNDKAITRDDFYLRANEEIGNLNGRKLFIECVLCFPELNGDIKNCSVTCPAFERFIYADKDDKGLKAKIRLEAEWNDSEYEDEVTSRVYWVTTSELVNFGEDVNKLVMASYDRKQIQIKYVPAYRDSKATLGNEVSYLVNLLEDYIEISPEDKLNLEELSKQLSDQAQELESIKTLTSCIEKVWSKSHDNTLQHYKNVKLEIVPAELREILKLISVRLSPFEDGSNKGIDHLSDGQVSLLYFTLAQPPMIFSNCTLIMS